MVYTICICHILTAMRTAVCFSGAVSGGSAKGGLFKTGFWGKPWFVGCPEVHGRGWTSDSP